MFYLLIFFPPSVMCELCSENLSSVSLILLEMEGWKLSEGPQKALQSLSFNLTRRREVSWKRKYISLLFGTLELTHCLWLLTIPCMVLCYKHVATQHLNYTWALAVVSKRLAGNQWPDTRLGGHGHLWMPGTFHQRTVAHWLFVNLLYLRWGSFFHKHTVHKLFDIFIFRTAIRFNCRYLCLSLKNTKGGMGEML